MSKFSFFSQNQFIRARGRLLDLRNEIVMAILNLSQDSFNKESIITSENQLLARAENAIFEGAEILDLGAASSRPGALEISVDDEWKILAPALKKVRKHFPETWISVDTYRAEIAHRAALEGCDIINDISGGVRDDRMLTMVAEAELPFVIMHMRGNSNTMGKENNYSDMIAEIIHFFNLRIKAAKDAGIEDIILDPGFGFSKVHNQNYELLAGMKNFLVFGYPILAGLSRKSMISHLLGTDTADSLNGTTAVNMIALEQGASILRVHDVKEAMQTIRIFEAFKSQFSRV